MTTVTPKVSRNGNDPLEGSGKSKARAALREGRRRLEHRTRDPFLRFILGAGEGGTETQKLQNTPEGKKALLSD